MEIEMFALWRQKTQYKSNSKLTLFVWFVDQKIGPVEISIIFDWSAQLKLKWFSHRNTNGCLQIIQKNNKKKLHIKHDHCKAINLFDNNIHLIKKEQFW